METTVKTVENANMSANRLSDLYESARQANYWSSFDPDRAARTEINGYEATLAEDLTTIPVEEQQEYIDNFKAHLRTIFARSSRIASPMVTGPAKFNYRRNEKANASYQNAIDDFDTWRARAKRSIARKVEAAKPQEQKEDEEWQVLRCGIAESLSIIKGIDEDGDMWTRSAFTTSIYGKVERKAQAGKMALVEKAMAFIEDYNGKHKKPVFTKRHKWYRLPELAKRFADKNEQEEETGSVSVAFDTCEVIKNYTYNRLQIRFDGKLEAEVRSTLKSHGFRWSPASGTWQRILTSNAIYELGLLNLGIDTMKVRKV